MSPVLPRVLYQFESIRIVQVADTNLSGVVGLGDGPGRWIHFVVEYNDGVDSTGASRWQTAHLTTVQTLGLALVDVLRKHGELQ